MTTGIPDSLERLTQADLIGVVRELIGEVGRLRAENEKLSGALTKLKTEHQAIRDEACAAEEFAAASAAEAFRHGQGNGPRRVVLRPALGRRRQERQGREVAPSPRQSTGQADD